MGVFISLIYKFTGIQYISLNEIVYDKMIPVWATNAQNIDWKIYFARTVENLRDFKIKEEFNFFFHG